jgi:hypothetical protein
LRPGILKTALLPTDIKYFAIVKIATKLTFNSTGIYGNKVQNYYSERPIAISHSQSNQDLIEAIELRTESLLWIGTRRPPCQCQTWCDNSKRGFKLSITVTDILDYSFTQIDCGKRKQQARNINCKVENRFNDYWLINDGKKFGICDRDRKSLMTLTSK